MQVTQHRNVVGMSKAKAAAFAIRKPQTSGSHVLCLLFLLGFLWFQKLPAVLLDNK